MKHWGVAILAHLLILAVGFGSMGAGFFDVAVFHAPVVNLLLWTGIICLAGLAFSAARPGLQRGLGWLLLTGALAWFPISVFIFGNARFSGTSVLLWNAWLIGTGGLILTSLLSLVGSGVAGCCRWRRRNGVDAD